MSALVYPELALHEAGATISILGSVLLVGVAAGLAGRAFLSWFPAGSIGGHSPRELPVTWAASHLVGLVWLLAVREVATDAAWLWVALGTPALAGVARLVTSPAELVPRHEPAPRRASPAARAVIAAAVIAAGIASARRLGNGIDPLLGATICAAVILAHEALALARVQPWIRAATVVAIAAAIALLPHRAVGLNESFAALGACGVATGVVGWIRRGDRRALAIAAAGLAFVVVSRTGTDPGLVLALPIAVAIGTARRSRLRAFAWLASGVAAASATLHFSGRLTERSYVSRATSGAVVEIALLALVVAALCAAYLLRIRRPTPTWNPSGAPESREARILGCAAVAAIALAHVGSCRVSDSLPSSGWPAESPASASTWVLLLVAVAIPLARTLERARSA